MTAAPDLCKKLALCLLAERDSSSFLQRSFALLQEERPKTSFAGLARKMGFSSRSFVRQLFLGTRHPNLMNYRQIAQGLGLSRDATKYFGLLVEVENFHGEVPSALRKRLDTAEEELRLRLRKRVRSVRKKDPVPFERWPFIYASLGTPESGRTLQEVVAISGQDPRICTEILDYLLKKEIILWDTQKQRYFPKEEMIDIGELGSSPILKNLYKMISLEALRRVDTDMAKREALFHGSVFSVEKENLPKIADELQNLLSSYAARSEQSTGTQLALLCTSLVPLKTR